MIIASMVALCAIAGADWFSQPGNGKLRDFQVPGEDSILVPFEITGSRDLDSGLEYIVIAQGIPGNPASGGRINISEWSGTSRSGFLDLVRDEGYEILFGIRPTSYFRPKSRLWKVGFISTEKPRVEAIVIDADCIESG